MGEVKGIDELNKTHGHLFFKKLGIPPSKIQGEFIEELIKLSLQMISSDCEEINFCCKEITANNDYSYPLLKKYLNKVYLKKVDCYITWGWNHNVSSTGLTEDELIHTIESKVEKAKKYKQKDIDELWLLIFSGHQLSQAMGIQLLDKLSNYDQLNNMLGQSEFEKVYIYQHMHSVIYKWPGWKKIGKESFL